MPGMGASSKIFEYLKFPAQYEIVHLSWLPPFKNELLSEIISVIGTFSNKRILQFYLAALEPILQGKQYYKQPFRNKDI